MTHSTRERGAAVPAAAPDSTRQLATDFERIPGLADVLGLGGGSNQGCEIKAQRLARTHGLRVYSDLIHLVTHLRLDPAEAELHWNRILEHQHFMSERLGFDVDPRVAMASYFVAIRPRIREPKIIEAELFDQTRASAYRDELTGLCNYRFFAEFLPHEISKSSRTGSPLTLIMLDIDYFKRYNDAAGHAAGNAALAALAVRLEASIGEADVAVRYGGEEFVVILPATGKGAGLAAAERIRAAVESCDFPRGESQAAGRLSVSLGVATHPADAADDKSLVEQADRALYAAKAAGRNRVESCGQSSRSFSRADARVAGEVRGLETAAHALETRQVGEGGCRIITDCQPSLGALMELELRLPGAPGPVRLAGRVVRVDPEAGAHSVALQFVGVAAPERAILADYVRSLA